LILSVNFFDLFFNFFIRNYIMDVLSMLNDLQEQADSGKLGSFKKWPEKGSAFVKDIELEDRNGNDYFAIILQDYEDENCTHKFYCRVPRQTDSDGSKYMAMQRLKSAFGSIQTAIGAKGYHDFLSVFKSFIGTNRIKVDFELSEYTSISQTNGRQYTNQSIESLIVTDIEDIEDTEEAPF